MRTILGVIVVSSLAFIGTMFDNFFAFSAQLIVTDTSRFRRVTWAQASGVASLIIIAGAIGALLEHIPLRWIGVLCVAPFWFAWHAWRARATPREQFRRGAITTYLLTLSLGGDNLAVWIPLLRANGLGRAFLTVLTFGVWELIFVASAERVAHHPRVVTWGTKYAPQALPFIYALLGVLILIECRTF